MRKIFMVLVLALFCLGIGTAWAATPPKVHKPGPVELQGVLEKETTTPDPKTPKLKTSEKISFHLKTTEGRFLLAVEGKPEELKELDKMVNLNVLVKGTLRPAPDQSLESVIKVVSIDEVAQDKKAAKAIRRFPPPKKS